MSKKLLHRRQRGQHLVEFASSLMLLVVFFLLPVMDIGVLLLRYSVASGLMQKQVGDLALCDKFSKAHGWFCADPQFNTAPFGVSVTESSIFLEATSLSDGLTQRFSEPRGISGRWLPNSSKGPFNYELGIAKDLQVAPLFSVWLGGMRVPGLTCPVRMHVESRCRWQNVTRDADTGDYYLNE